MNARARLVLVAALLVVGCARASNGDGPAASEVRRVVSLVPSMTEALYELGVGDRVVGVSDFCSWPPEARDKPRVGGFINPNIETIVGLQPDLVLVTDGQGELADKLGRLSLPVMQLRTETQAGVLESILRLGERLGRGDAARALRARVQGELEAVRTRAEGRPRVRTLVVVGHEAGSLRDIWVSGSGSFHEEMLRAAGGASVVGESAAAYPKMSKEAIIRAAPAAVIVLSSEDVSEADGKQERALWAPLGNIPAWAEGRICLVGGEWVNKPGPRAARVARAFQDCLYQPAAEGP